MALTPSLPSGAIGWLSKAKIGDSVYAIKDAELRALLNSAATLPVITSIDDQAATNNDIPTTKAILDYLEEAIQGLTGAMHFAGVTTPDDSKTAAERIALVDPNPEAGDIVIDGTTEYVYDGSAWKELGDEGVYATKGELASAISDIVIAGVELGNDSEITVAELQAALGLGDFAYANTGTASLQTVDSATVDMPSATLTLSGTAIAVPQTFSAMDATPSGSVSAVAEATSISYDKFASGSVVVPDLSGAQYQEVASINVSSAAAGAGDTANYTPAGSVSVSADAAATFNAATTSVATVTDAGTAYSISGGGVSQAAATSASFAYEGVVAAMDTTDTEMLVLSAAGTTNAVTEVGALTFTTPTLSGALPTFGSADVATGGTISLPSFSGAFTGTGAVLSATANMTNASLTGVGSTNSAVSNVSFSAVSVTVPAQSISASFVGNSLSLTPQVATSANAAPADAEVNMAGATLTVDLVKTAKTITVTPAV